MSPMISIENISITDEKAAIKFESRTLNLRPLKAAKPVAIETPVVIAKNSPLERVAMLALTKIEPATKTKNAAPMISHCCTEIAARSRLIRAGAVCCATGGVLKLGWPTIVLDPVAAGAGV